MKITKYKSYTDYIVAQEKGHNDYPKAVWAKKENIEFLSFRLKGSRFGICHGTRKGQEIIWFKQMLPGCHIIGTEISKKASGYPDTIHHDFHEPHKRLHGADFVYTNSLDHAYDPRKAVMCWFNQLLPYGQLIIEHSSKHEEPATARDPFSATVKEIVELISLCAVKLRLSIQMNVIDTPVHHSKIKYSKFIIAKRKK